MEQRIYRGNFTPDGLANHLVQHFSQERHLTGQKLGEGNSVAVQIGRPDGNRLRNAVMVGIARSQENPQDIMVTLGEQEWIHSGSSIYPVAGSLIGLLFTPWALFGLLWPAQHALGQYMMPTEIWNNVDFYVASQGGTMVQAQDLAHPHLAETRT